MISKDQFLELKHLKSLGVPTTTIAKKIGISVPNANKWRGWTKKPSRITCGTTRRISNSTVPSSSAS